MLQQTRFFAATRLFSDVQGHPLPQQEQVKLAGASSPIFFYHIARFTFVSNVSKPRILVVEPVKMLHCPIKRVLQDNYPNFEILTALDVDSAMHLFEYYKDLQCNFNLVILELVIPQNPASSADVQKGIELVKTFMLPENHAPNIAVSTPKFKCLVRIKPLIDSYRGGFAASDKFSSGEDLLNVVEPAFNGLQRLPPEVRSLRKSNGTEVDFADIKPIWIEMVELTIEQGYTDEAIASRLGKCPRTLNNYWDALGDFLGIVKDDKKALKSKQDRKDFKLEICIRAREIGLICC